MEVGHVAVNARDVARVAGVSVSTVSRALAKPNEVAPETLARVLDTARGMGYRPNLTARGLITGHSGAIGLIVPDLENPFFSSVAKGVQSRARAGGYAVMIADSDEDPSQEAELVREMSRHVDGIVLCSPRAPDSVIEELAQECVIALVNRRCGNLPAVLIDNVDGVRQAMAHLRALGHRTIAYVGGPSTSWSSQERLAAARTVAAQHSDTLRVRGRRRGGRPHRERRDRGARLQRSRRTRAARASAPARCRGPRRHQRRGRGQHPDVGLELTGPDQRRDPPRQLRARWCRRAPRPHPRPVRARDPAPRPVVPARGARVHRSSRGREGPAVRATVPGPNQREGCQ
jgi:hypothetical protein